MSLILSGLWEGNILENIVRDMGLSPDSIPSNWDLAATNLDSASATFDVISFATSDKI